MRQLHNIPAENALLGCVLLDPGLTADLTDKAQAIDFVDHRNSEVYDAICQLHDKKQPVEMIAISEITGDLNHLGTIYQNANSPAAFDHYLTIVLNYSKERGLHNLGQAIHEALFLEESTTSERVNKIQKMFTELSSERLPSTVHTMKDAIVEYVEILDERFKNPGCVGITTGLKDYDARLRGFNGGDMVVIAGTPGSGKTTFGMQIVVNAAKQGKRGMIFSLEMPKAQLTQRLMASVGSIPLDSLKDASVCSNEDSYKLSPAAAQIASMDVVIDDQGGLDIADLKSRARAAHRAKPLEVILIDYLQLLSNKSEKDRFQVVSSVSREIKALAKELNCPIIALSQLNREIMKRADKHPQLSDLRESGQIEQDADVITFTYREYIFNDQCDNPNGAELITKKFRDGEQGTDYVEFQGMFNRFVDTQWIPKPHEEVKGGKGFHNK